MAAQTERGAGNRPDDDLVLPFRTVRSDVIGRVVRLGPVVDTVLSRHAYPEPVSHALGEALALTAMLGSALKSEAASSSCRPRPTGRSTSWSPTTRRRASCAATPASTRPTPLSPQTKGRGDQGALLGKGHVAMTIDPGGDRDRYQGIVALDGEPLVEAAHTYFRQSEQLPTFIRLAVARHYGPGAARAQRGWRWRAGGLMIQQLPREGGKREPKARRTTRASRATTRRTGTAPGTWPPPSRTTSCSIRCCRPSACSTGCSTRRACAVTPATGAGRRMPLLARAHPRLPAAASAPRSSRTCASPTAAVTVTCEFCSRKYRFSQGEF